jgi:cytochrome P450
MRMTHPTDSSHVNLSEFDLRDPSFYKHGDPHLVYHAMRHRAPVHWQQTGEGVGFWSFTKHADCIQVLRDHRTFTSEQGSLLNILGVQDPAGGRQMAVTDPPNHGKMRRPLETVMNDKAVVGYADIIRDEIRNLLAPALSGEVIDLAPVMVAMSTAVAGTVLNLPREDWPHLTRLTAMCIAPDDPMCALPEGTQATLDRAHRELFAYFQDIMLKRRRNPGRDPISILLSVEIGGEKLGAGAIVSNCYSLLLGATVTTPHVPLSALLELIEQNGYEEWAAHPEAIPTGVEEALRWASPANHFLRYALKDTEIRGTKIKKGDAVVTWLGSANRDEDVFENPYKFDFRRTPNRHIAFGSGVHLCVGHAAARQTLSILFEELFQNFRSIELAGEVEHLASDFAAGIIHMPVVAHARPESERSIKGIKTITNA